MKIAESYFVFSATRASAKLIEKVFNEPFNVRPLASFIASDRKVFFKGSNVKRKKEIQAEGNERGN